MQSFLLIRRTFVIHGFNYRKFRFPENTRIPRIRSSVQLPSKDGVSLCIRARRGYEKIEYRETVTYLSRHENLSILATRRQETRKEKRIYRAGYVYASFSFLHKEDCQKMGGRGWHVSRRGERRVKRAFRLPVSNGGNKRSSFEKRKSSSSWITKYKNWFLSSRGKGKERKGNCERNGEKEQRET